MASIKKYASATSKTGYAWRVQYRSQDGKSRTKQGFRTKSEAEAWAEKNAVNMAEGSWIDPAHGKITVAQLGERWLAMQTHLKPSTARVVEQSWRVHVLPAWGDRRIGSILPSEVQAWVSSINRSASIVRKAHACLAQILDMAVKDRQIVSNPARNVRLPRKPKGKKVYLTVPQLKALAEESKYPELVWLLGTVGLRWGEAAALRVRDVNPLRNRISIERNAVTVGSDVHIGTPKTHEARTVAVTPFIMDMLVRLMEGRAVDDLLWSSQAGGPLHLPAKDGWYHGALNRVMSADPDFPRVTPHGLRHVAAGLMVSSGANVKVVQRQLGHASAAMTLDTYADLFDDDLDGVAAAMNEVLILAEKTA